MLLQAGLGVLDCSWSRGRSCSRQPLVGAFRCAKRGCLAACVMFMLAVIQVGLLLPVVGCAYGPSGGGFFACTIIQHRDVGC